MKILYISKFLSQYKHSNNFFDYNQGSFLVISYPTVYDFAHMLLIEIELNIRKYHSDNFVISN